MRLAEACRQSQELDIDYLKKRKQACYGKCLEEAIPLSRAGLALDRLESHLHQTTYPFGNTIRIDFHGNQPSAQMETLCGRTVFAGYSGL